MSDSKTSARVFFLGTSDASSAFACARVRSAKPRVRDGNDVVVADWAGAAAAHQDLLAGDRIHPGPTGGRLFAETVATAVQCVENARAQAAFDRSVRVSALASRLVDGDDDREDGGDADSGADAGADTDAGPGGDRGVSADLPER